MNDDITMPLARAARGDSQLLPLRFTGSGSEYFRIWIVNLLLTLVTLGVYFPWAKVRRLRYFYGNTLVGDEPLDFHGDPKRMLRGYLLVGLLLILNSAASHVSPVASVIAIVILAALWPALFRAGLQFRMANTSWRGLRFRFSGDMAGAYKAMLPLFVPAVLLVGVGASAGADQGRPSAAQGLVALAAMLVAALVVPLFLWMLKKYQHDGYGLGQEQTTLQTGPGSFYGVFMKTSAVSGGILVPGGIVAALIIPGLVSHPQGGRALAAIAAMVGFFVLYVIVAIAARPYMTSRLQNLLWSRTASAALQFDSALRFRSLLGLTLKNWLLIVLTLGLYWPFAAVAMARLRLEAVSVRSALAPEELVSAGRQRADDASGDAAGDLFGIDIGL